MNTNHHSHHHHHHHPHELIFSSASLPKELKNMQCCNDFLVLYFARYERFLKIMILSVLKNTRRPVKFWFIKNYLSPQFKVVSFKLYICHGFLLFVE